MNIQSIIKNDALMLSYCFVNFLVGCMVAASIGSGVGIVLAICSAIMIVECVVESLIKHRKTKGKQ